MKKLPPQCQSKGAAGGVFSAVLKAADLLFSPCHLPVDNSEAASIPLPYPRCRHHTAA